MARARNIKPGFFSNDRLAEIVPLGRLLFAGLWTIADRAGRLEDRPKKIKAEVLPYDNCNIDKLLNVLQDAEFILRYQVGKTRYIQILKFDKHQNPHKNEAESTIPAPEEHPTSTVQEPAKDGTNRADSLIPDSLNSDSGFPRTDSLQSLRDLSGLPDVDKPERKNGRNYVAQAEAVMGYLNRSSGKGFEFRTRNGDLTASAEKIIQRLKQGYTPEELKEVAYAKCGQWKHDDRMAEFLRPSTLFGKEKFEQYLGEIRGTNGMS